MSENLYHKRFISVLNWRLDIEKPEFIEKLNSITGLQYCKDHYSIEGSISQDDLNKICDQVNIVLERMGNKLRITNSMGEFIPVKLEENKKMSENYEPIKIILTKEQAKRLAAFLEDHIFNGMADICESVNYQIDHKEFKLIESLINDFELDKLSYDDFDNESDLGEIDSYNL